VNEKERTVSITPCDKNVPHPMLVLKDKSVLYKDIVTFKAFYRLGTKDFEVDEKCINDSWLLALVEVSDFNSTKIFEYFSKSPHLMVGNSWPSRKGFQDYIDKEEMSSSLDIQIDVLAKHFLGDSYKEIKSA
jgi:hypothetical protein